MTLKSVFLLIPPILLLGCSDDNIKVTSAEPEPVKVIQLPANGGFLTAQITDHSNLKKALKEYREANLESGNLSDLSKLKSIREEYSKSLIGSGSVFALSPEIERDYEIKPDAGTETLSVTLTRQPYLTFACFDIEPDKDYFRECKPNIADSRTSLSFHNILNLEADDFTLNVPSNIIEENAENIESVYFVSFELPQEALSNVNSYYSYKNENKGDAFDVTDWQYSYNETAYMIFDRQALKTSNGQTLLGNFHGVALVDKTSGEVLASNIK